MNGGTAADTDGDLYANWLPSGVWQGLLSGYHYDDLGYQGDEGNYWSSTANDTDGAYFLYFHDKGVVPGDGGDKYLGYAVRCLI